MVQVPQIKATRELERRQDHKQEEPITQHIFHCAHRSSSTSPAQSSPVLRPTRSNGLGDTPTLYHFGDP